MKRNQWTAFLDIMIETFEAYKSTATIPKGSFEKIDDLITSLKDSDQEVSS